MKIVLRTPTRLVIHDGAFKTVLVGALFATVGGGFITSWRVNPSAWSGNGGGWIIYLVGGTFCILGIALMAMSADRRFELDGSTRTARIITSRIVHRTSRDYPFDTLKDVALERSDGSGSSSAFYRIVFLTRSGEHVPWTPYGTGDDGSMTNCAAAVRAFCGWADSNPAAPPPPAPPARTSAISGHPVVNNWGCLASFLAIFVAVGLGTFGTEVYRVNTWQPVSARVLSTDIKSVRGNKGTTYAPVVQYQYTFGGTDYSVNTVTPIQMSAGPNWAENLRSRFHPGETVTAYVNPKNPSNAFLVHEVSLLPLLFVALPLVFGAVIYWIDRVQRRQTAAMQSFPVPIVDRDSALAGLS